jgi:hypothetical protein
MEDGTNLKHPFELFGIEHGPGWYPLIYPILAQIHLWNRTHKESQCSIQQIKEKFGGLCFYARVPEHIQKMIDKAESKSYHICEHCGSTKNVGQTKGWVHTVCQECLEKNKNIHDYHNTWRKIKPEWFCKLKNQWYNHIYIPYLYKIEKQWRNLIMTKEQKISKIEVLGYKITKLGKNIKAEKLWKDKLRSYTGSVSKVHKDIYGY